MTDAAVPTGRRQRSLHCGPEEQAMIRERAAAAGKTVSRHVLDLALADEPDRHRLVLTREEQAELRDGVRAVEAFVRALRRELPGGSGLNLLAAIAVLARLAPDVPYRRLGAVFQTQGFLSHLRSLRSLR